MTIIQLSALIPLLCSVMNSNFLVIIASAFLCLVFFFHVNEKVNP